MANNEIKIPGYDKFLEEGKAMLDSAIKKYESDLLTPENNEAHEESTNTNLW